MSVVKHRPLVLVGDDRAASASAPSASEDLARQGREALRTSRQVLHEVEEAIHRSRLVLGEGAEEDGGSQGPANGANPDQGNEPPAR